MQIEVSPDDVNITELITDKYTKDQLMEIIGIDETIWGLNSQYTIQCVRKAKNGFRVAYCGDSNIAIVIFDNNGEKRFSQIYNVLHFKSDFDSLLIGQSLEEVQRIDPAGDYTFLYTGRNDSPRISTHFTCDGFLIKFLYDGSNSIIHIDTEFI